MNEKTASAEKIKILITLNKLVGNGNSPTKRVINAAFIRSYPRPNEKVLIILGWSSACSKRREARMNDGRQNEAAKKVQSGEGYFGKFILLPKN